MKRNKCDAKGYKIWRFLNGEESTEFEKKFADFLNTKYSIMVNSGSSANLLMIAALFYKA